MNEFIDDSFAYNPYVASVVGKDEAGQQEFFERFYRLDQRIKDFMTSPQTTAFVENIFDSGIAPETHAIAIAKIIALLAMRDVQQQALPGLLEKLSLSPQQSQQIAQSIAKIVDPILHVPPTSPPQELAPSTPSLNEMPPMTRPTEQGPRPIVTPQVPEKNVINLKKQT